MELLDHGGNECLALLEPAEQLSHVAGPFYPHSTSLTLDTVRVLKKRYCSVCSVDVLLYFNHYERCREGAHHGFNLHSLMRSVGHLSRVIAFWTSSSAKCLFHSDLSTDFFEFWF